MQSGTLWTEPDLEFAQMLYSGLEESPLIRGIMQSINVERVQTLFHPLQEWNPRREQYNDAHMQDVVLRNKA